MPTDADWAFFRRCEEALYALYAGKWVLIYQGQFIGAYDRQDDVFAAASGRMPCLIQHLGPEASTPDHTAARPPSPPAPTDN
jgi:hypothetical protein